MISNYQITQKYRWNGITNRRYETAGNENREAQQRLTAAKIYKKAYTQMHKQTNTHYS